MNVVAIGSGKRTFEVEMRDGMNDHATCPATEFELAVTQYDLLFNSSSLRQNFAKKPLIATYSA